MQAGALLDRSSRRVCSIGGRRPACQGTFRILPKDIAATDPPRQSLKSVDNLALALLTSKYIRVSSITMKKGARPYVMTARAAKAEATRARIRASAMQLYRERAIKDITLDEVAK